MNLKTTIVLLALILLGACVWLAVALLTPARVTSETIAVLERDLRPENLTRIEVARGERRVVLEKGPGGWSLPGKWPVRQPEVEHLVGILTSLRSRFAPISVESETDLKKLGLGAGALPVTVKADGKEYQLTFGEEPGQRSRFSRPTYLRLGEAREALRVAPGLVAALDRPQEFFMQRRLFPIERVVKEGGERGEKIEQLAAQAVAVKGGSDNYVIVRTGDSWELREPVRDRVDPDKMKSILTNLPDVWVEKFVEPGQKSLEDFGLKEPAQVIKVTRPAGDIIILLVGKTSDKRSRVVQKPGASPFMPKPQIDFIEEEFKFAKLQDNEQIFEIKADRLKDVVVAASTLRDPQLARFKTEDVKNLTVQEGGRGLNFIKEEGTWKLYLQDKFAFEVERSKVDDILDKLSGLRASDKDIIDKADPKAHGLEKPATIKVTVEEGKDKEKKKKEFTFLLGKQEAGDKGKLHVQVAGWDRVNLVEGDLLKLVQRPALAYRNRRLLNFAASDAARVEVERQEEKYALEQTGSTWRLAAPVQAELDSSKADSVPRELGQLEAVEFITSEPKVEDLDKVYGLTRPAGTLKVVFVDKKKPEQVIHVGKKREGKEEYYARIGTDTTVFTIRKDVFDTLTRESLALRPTELWKLEPDDIAEVRLRKGEEFALVREGEGWKLTGPFAAIVTGEAVKPLTSELAHLKVEKYVAHAATDLARYGLDNPYLRVTIKPGAKKDQDKDKEKETKERVLLVGKTTDKDAKTRFARLGDGEAIFVLGESAVTGIDRGPLDLLERKLLALDTSAIQSIHTQTGQQTFTLTRDKETWKLERSDGPGFPVDQEVIDDTLALWSSLVAQKVAGYGDKVDLAKFGLDRPRTTITLTMEEKDEKGKPGKKERKLKLGGEVPGAKGERYAQVEGSRAVGVLDAAVVGKLERTTLDFFNHTLLKLRPETVTAVTRTMGSDTLELVKKGENWRMVKPADQPADDTTLRELAGELAKLRAKKVAAYPVKDLKLFGLDNPAAVVSLRVTEVNSNEHVLKIGRQVEGKSGARYAQLGKSDAVVVLAEKLVGQLLAPPLQFRDRLMAKAPNIGKIVVERGIRKVTFALKDGEWKMTHPLEAEAEQVDLGELVKALAELRADRLVAEKPNDLKPFGLDRPQGQWQFFSTDGNMEVLTLLVGGREKDGRRLHVKLANSDLVALLDEKLSGRLLEEYRSRKVWPSLDSFQVEKLTYGYEKGSFTLHKVGSDWQVAGKSDLKVKSDAVRDTLDALARLKAERWVIDRDADPRLFGLEPPFLTLEVETGTAKRTLKVGRKEGNSDNYYALVVGENNGGVFLIGATEARTIVRPLEGFLAGKS